MPRQYTPHVPLICPTCGKTFHRPPSVAKRRTFCSYECSIRQRPLRKPRTAKTCAACGKTFEVLPSSQHQRFCSLECGRLNRTIDQGFMKACPTCGDAFYSTTKSKRVYCSRKCANDRDRERNQRTCPACEAVFQAGPSKTDVYCSIQCFRDSRVQHPRPCEYCGSTYQPNFPKQRFCSPECQRSSKRKRTTISCSRCGKPVEVWESRAQRTRYCSHRCRLEDLFHSNEEDVIVAHCATILASTPIRQHTFPWLRSPAGRLMHVDAYFPEHRIAVEYDGKQHREFMPFYHRTTDVFHRLQQRDAIKDRLLPEHNIRLLRVRDDEPRTLEHIRQRLAILDAASARMQTSAAAGEAN